MYSSRNGQSTEGSDKKDVATKSDNISQISRTHAHLDMEKSVFNILNPGRKVLKPKPAEKIEFIDFEDDWDLSDESELTMTLEDFKREIPWL